MSPSVTAVIRELAVEGSKVYQSLAPEESGRLKREIKGVSLPGKFYGEIRSDPVDRESGYHYIGVTRFGHRARVIRPRNARSLRFEVDGGVIFRRRVRGFRPVMDWAEGGLPVMKLLGQSAIGKIGDEWASRSSDQ